MSSTLAAELANEDFPQAELFRGVVAGRFGLLCLDTPNDRLSTDTLRGLGEPYIIVMSANYGPGRFCSARALRSWAAFAIVHATEERQGDYAIIGDMAMRHKRLLLVETTASIARSWFAFLQAGPATMGLIGRHG